MEREAASGEGEKELSLETMVEKRVKARKKGREKEGPQAVGSLFRLEILIHLKPNVTMLPFTEVHCSDLQTQLKSRKAGLINCLSNAFWNFERTCILP